MNQLVPYDNFVMKRRIGVHNNLQKTDALELRGFATYKTLNDFEHTESIHLIFFLSWKGYKSSFLTVISQ